eukprot:3173941-Heterocapsa_arctica.AAC.1
MPQRKEKTKSGKAWESKDIHETDINKSIRIHQTNRGVWGYTGTGVQGYRVAIGIDFLTKR